MYKIEMKKKIKEIQPKQKIVDIIMRHQQFPMECWILKKYF